MLFVEILIFTSFLKACGFAWFGGLVGFFLVAVGLMCLRRCFFLGLRCVNLFARQRRPPSCRIRNREKKGTFCETKNGLAFNSNSEPFSRHALFVTRVKLGFVTPKQDQNRPHYWTLLGAHSRFQSRYSETSPILVSCTGRHSATHPGRKRQCPVRRRTRSPDFASMQRPHAKNH